MFLSKKFDKKTGIYRSKDSIENFRFRVTLKTLHSFVKVPKFNPEQLTDAEDLDETDFVHFRWQQKLFCARELTFFNKLENCKTDAEKRYYQQILSETSSATNPENGVIHKIFSYVNDDKFIEKDGDVRNTLVENVEKYGDNNAGGCNPSGFNEIVSDETNPEQIQKIRYQNLGHFECMHIMADLDEEILLFSIKYRSSDGLLLIYPDFNNIEINPYLKEIDSDSRNLYQYSIENVSTDFRQEQQYWSLKRDIESMANKLSDLCIKSPMDFNLPPTHCTNICLCMEINTAEYFEYDNIHIKYQITLPNRCELIDGDLTGSTHSSHRSNINGIWLIGYCHELNILCRHDYQFDEHLKIAYEVISIDGWERERTEGYTVIDVPLIAGRYLEKLNCYRDLDNDSLLNRLQRYFIGGRRKVHLNEFYGIGTEKISTLNRYGNKTETTGYLNIVRNVIVQRHIDGVTLKRSLNAKHQNRRQTTINNILSAYHEARERLDAITVDSTNV